MTGGIPYDRAVDLFDYCSDGNLRWRSNGLVAGSNRWIKNSQYRIVTIYGKRYAAHRLIWLWHNRVWPYGHIGHLDGDTLNNRIENLIEIPRRLSTVAPGMPATTVVQH